MRKICDKLGHPQCTKKKKNILHVYTDSNDCDDYADERIGIKDSLNAEEISERTTWSIITEKARGVRRGEKKGH